MKRDFICLLRVIVDSFPESIRNSKWLFNISKLFFNLPNDLFIFREKYDSNKIRDLSLYYSKNSSLSLKRISRDTDINSFHLRILKSYFKSQLPKSLLDAGCGSGYSLNQFKKLNSSTNLIGIDYETPFYKNNKFEFIEGDILESLKGFLENSFEFVICTHVLEHLTNPKEVIKELRRVCSNTLIIICPIEKKFKWGMNYHINFYPSKYAFIDLFKTIEFQKKGFHINCKTFSRLGDIMYIESI